MKKFGLFVPTYRRKSPLILQMLDKDPTLVINLCVRHEEIVSGFYDELARQHRVNIIDLGPGLTELGETRLRILQHCIENKFDYCFMFDDGIFDVNDSENPDCSITDVFNRCIEIMQNDPLKEFVIGMTFTKRKFIDPVTGELKTKRNRHLSETDRYFLVHAGQAIAIDVNHAVKFGIKYHSMEECGFEDAAFEGDAIKAGLVFCSRKAISIDGVVPNAAKAGGSHHDNFDLEKKYDKHNIRCLEYLNMLGLSLRKKYVDYCHSYLSLIEWPFDYYRDVLVYHRDENKKIIDSHFEIPEVEK